VVEHCDAAIVAAAYAELYASVAARPLAPAIAHG
jgi:hypothetical protein